MLSSVNASHHVEAKQYEPGIPDPAQADQHVLDLIFWNITPLFNFFLAPNWDVGVKVPLRMVRVDAAFLGFRGEVLDDFSSIHHRNEVLFGIADVPIDVGYTLRKPLPVGHQLRLRLGATLPTGETEPNPFELGRQGIDHQHIFFGTGTINPAWAASYVFGIQEHQLYVFSEGVHTIYENEHDFKGPSMITSGATFNYTFDPTWQFRGTLMTYNEWPARWNGELARNSGRFDVIPGLGVRWRMDDGLILGGSAQFPIVVSTDGGQIQMPWILAFNINYTGQFFEPDF